MNGAGHLLRISLQSRDTASIHKDHIFHLLFRIVDRNASNLSLILIRHLGSNPIVVVGVVLPYSETRQGQFMLPFENDVPRGLALHSRVLPTSGGQSRRR